MQKINYEDFLKQVLLEQMMNIAFPFSFLQDIETKLINLGIHISIKATVKTPYFLHHTAKNLPYKFLNSQTKFHSIHVIAMKQPKNTNSKVSQVCFDSF